MWILLVASWWSTEGTSEKRTMWPQLLNSWEVSNNIITETKQTQKWPSDPPRFRNSLLWTQSSSKSPVVSARQLHHPRQLWSRSAALGCADPPGTSVVREPQATVSITPACVWRHQYNTQKQEQLNPLWTVECVNISDLVFNRGKLQNWAINCWDR